MFLHKSYICENSCSWDIGWNALSQSDCRVFKSTISPEQIDEIASFFVWWYKFTKIRSYSKNFLVGYDQNVDVVNLVYWLKNWMYLKNEQMKLSDFFGCKYKFMQNKRWLNIFGVGMVKNGCAKPGDGTLKWTVSEQME